MTAWGRLQIRRRRHHRLQRREAGRPGVRRAQRAPGGQLAEAHDLSVYGALNYRAPGLLLGGGVFTGNTGQNGQSDALFKASLRN